MSKKILFPVDLERNKYVRDCLINKFQKYMELSKTDLLEIGIGNGRFGSLLGNKVKHYSGIDPDVEYVRIAKTNIPKDADIIYKVGSAENIPFNKKFDILFYPFSWHFIGDFHKALEEANRVLRVNGVIVILEPTEEAKNWADSRLNKDEI